MLRTLYAAAAFAIIGAPASIAGPYINAETNENWTEKKYTNATTEVHLGYAGASDSGKLSYYVQGGPAFVAVKDADTETRISGKAGASVALTEATDVYGELSFLTGEEKEDFATGGKLGIKYNF